MQARRAEVVAANVKGVEFLFRKNKVTWLKGTGRITEPGKVDVDGTSYDAKHIVIATGSESVPLAGVEVDEKQIVTSTGGLELGKVPGHLVVIGGGYIGLELGSVWRRLGADVTVVEFLEPGTCPTMDGEVAKAFERRLRSWLWYPLSLRFFPPQDTIAVTGGSHSLCADERLRVHLIAAIAIQSSLP